MQSFYESINHEIVGMIEKRLKSLNKQWWVLFVLTLVFFALSMWVFFSFIIGIIILCFAIRYRYTVVKESRLLARFYQYISIMDNQHDTSAAYLAERTSYSEENVDKDLSLVVYRHYFMPHIGYDIKDKKIIFVDPQTGIPEEEQPEPENQ